MFFSLCDSPWHLVQILICPSASLKQPELYRPRVVVNDGDVRQSSAWYPSESQASVWHAWGVMSSLDKHVCHFSGISKIIRSILKHLYLLSFYIEAVGKYF